MLETTQTSWAKALLHGPAHVPWDAFAADQDAIICAMKIHANTISHARLVALEDSYPRTRVQLGAEAFNQLSRRYLDIGRATGLRHAQVGGAFPEFLLENCGLAALATLAAAERAWLAAYHAADAAALRLADIAGLDPATMLQLRVARHPAAVAVAIAPRFAPFFDDGLSSAAGLLLITRPDADVCVRSSDAATIALLPSRADVTKLGALLEQAGDDGATALAQLIEAGALTLAAEQGEGA
jgi:Putative DNA-binding domain